MPPRQQAVHKLAVHKLVGDGMFWFKSDGVDPRCGVTNEQYEEMKAEVDKDFVFLATTVDWNRVIGMAVHQHVMVMADGGDEHHEPGDNVEGYIDAHICGWCIEHALLHER